ncbi:hypothetical protein CR513_16813, partial [Mucuna pruriens]
KRRDIEDYKFKLGVEFTYLIEFKEATLEYAMLNGRELKVSASCNRIYDFTTFMSKVQQSHTYGMNTLMDKHTCGKVVVDKLILNNNVSLSQIIIDVRVTYSTHITKSHAWKGKQIAKDIAKGEEENNTHCFGVIMLS